MTRGFLNGETWPSKPRLLHTESIGMQGEPGELKGKEPKPQDLSCGVMDSNRDQILLAEWFWESQPERVKASYAKTRLT